MKKNLLLFVAILFASFSYAQTDDEIKIMQDAFGMQKKAVVEHFVHLTEAQKANFWKIYDEYEVKRKELAKKRIALLKDYAEKWENMTDEQANVLMKELLTQQKATDKLLQSYYKKVKKVTSPKTAMQFYQVETYILTLTRFSILEGIPFVGEK